MCLKLTDSTKKVAEEDIIVYKVIDTSIAPSTDSSFGLVLKTPYRHVTIEIGETYTSELYKNSEENVEIGLHSFADLKGALRDSDSTLLIVECIIPRGSQYYEGIFKFNKSYASNTLKYIKILKKCHILKEFNK